MKVSEIIDKLGLIVFSGKVGLDREVSGAYVSDLLSDVMGNAEEGMVWITLQTHRNVLAIASLKELAAVILVKELEPEADMLEHAKEEEIPVLGTSLSTFELAGELYKLLAN